MTECMGPLCSRKGARMSTSGTMESTNAAGVLKLVLETFADPTPRIYARARCPTAKRLLFLRFKQERCFIRLLSLLSSDIIANATCLRAEPRILIWVNCWRRSCFLRVYWRVLEPQSWHTSYVMALRGNWSSPFSFLSDAFSFPASLLAVSSIGFECALLLF